MDKIPETGDILYVHKYFVSDTNMGKMLMRVTEVLYFNKSSEIKYAVLGIVLMGNKSHSIGDECHLNSLDTWTILLNKRDEQSTV